MQPDLVERGTYGPFVIEIYRVWWPSHLGSFVSAGHAVRWLDQRIGWGYSEPRFLFPTPGDALNHAFRMIDD
jgi:hypothetical protein